MVFDWQYAGQIAPVLLQATITTLGATVGGFTLAVVLGLLIAVVRLSGSRPASACIVAFVEIVRSTPLLVQLFFAFYVLPEFGIALSPLTTGIAALGLHYSAYTSEVYRAGILGVMRGQWEAATALNLSSRDTWLRIILPQAIPPVLPPLGNYLLAMFKDTPLLATITVSELLGTALNLASQSFRYNEPLLLVGLIFLMLSLPASLAVTLIQRKVATPH